VTVTGDTLRLPGGASSTVTAWAAVIAAVVVVVATARQRGHYRGAVDDTTA